MEIERRFAAYVSRVGNNREVLVYIRTGLAIVITVYTLLRRLVLGVCTLHHIERSMPILSTSIVIYRSILLCR